MTNKLLPCPFCGSPYIRETHRPNANVITCQGCEVQIRQSGLGYGDAAFRWNRRDLVQDTKSNPVAWRWSFDSGATWNHGTEKPGDFRFGNPDVVEPLYPVPQPDTTGDANFRALVGMLLGTIQRQRKFLKSSLARDEIIEFDNAVDAVRAAWTENPSPQSKKQWLPSHDDIVEALIDGAVDWKSGAKGSREDVQANHVLVLLAAPPQKQMEDKL